MDLIVRPPAFQALEASHTGRLSATLGQAVVPADNAYGTTVQVGSALSFDAYLFEVVFHSLALAGNATAAMLSIVRDTAGGTAWAEFIQHLLVGQAGGLTGLATSATAGGGVRYRFPVFIPAGTTIGAKLAIDNTAYVGPPLLGEPYVYWRAWGRPEYPTWAGTFVQTIGTSGPTAGAGTGNCDGTAFTPGTTSVGAWANLGTLDREIYAWECGYHCDDLSTGSKGVNVELGLGSTAGDRGVIDGLNYQTGTAEMLGKVPGPWWGVGHVGQNVYVRAQVSGGSDANCSAAAYGVG